MATITIRFSFCSMSGDDTESAEFETDSNISLVTDLEEHAEEWISEANEVLDEDDDNTDEWELVGWDVIDFDDDFNDPDSFTTLDEYNDYVSSCEEHGEAYQLRFDDIGEHNFSDEYNGCWTSEEEFVQDLVESCGDIPDNLTGYIDWESMACDYMMDYSSYGGSEGIHIFRN